MKNQIIRFLKKSKKVVRYRRYFNILKSLHYKKINGEEKLYPKVIQLPITYKCNARCVMCNIWNMDYSNEMDSEEFANFMRDPIFKEVHSVGINGGEPTLVKNLSEYTNSILTLPSLTSLNIISHGFNVKPLFKNLELIYEQCKAHSVEFHVSISLDGLGMIHNEVRGRPKAFINTLSSIMELKNNQYKYCDSFDIGCTVLKQNVNHLVELDAFANKNNLPIKYRLGIENKRIESNKLINQFSVMYSTEIQSAKEFFHGRFLMAQSFSDQFKYFSIFYWLNVKNKKRLLGCIWKNEGITLDSRGELYYCAVASEKLGSLRQQSGSEIFFKPENIKHRKQIIQHNCDGCIHDYSGPVEFTNFLVFLKAVIFERSWLVIYRIRTAFLFFV